jgi:hypothetical protein
MAAKKGKTRSSKVKSLKSKRVDADQATRVKGGLLPAVDMSVQKVAEKWAPVVNRAIWK